MSISDYSNYYATRTKWRPVIKHGQKMYVKRFGEKYIYINRKGGRAKMINNCGICENFKAKYKETNKVDMTVKLLNGMNHDEVREVMDNIHIDTLKSVARATHGTMYKLLDTHARFKS